MKEELISFETAKLAKEKGFSEIIFEGDGKGNLTGIHKAPTQSLLQTWLRKNHGIHIKIEAPIISENVWHYALYYHDKFNKDWNLIRDAGGVNKSYERVLESGLQKALKLI